MTGREEFWSWFFADHDVEIEHRVAVPSDALARLTAAVETLRRALPPLLVSVDQAAQTLSVSLRTARRRVKDGTWPVRRDGRRILVNLSALNGPTAEEVRTAVCRLRKTSADP